MNYSTEQAARIIQTISFILGLFGKNLGIGNDELTAVLAAIMFAGATAYGWYKRYQQGDLKFFGARKCKK